MRTGWSEYEFAKTKTGNRHFYLYIAHVIRRNRQQGAASVWQFCTIQPSSLYGILCEWLDTQSTYSANQSQCCAEIQRRTPALPELGDRTPATYNTFILCRVAQFWILLRTLRFCLIPAARTKGSRVIKVKQKNVPSQCA